MKFMTLTDAGSNRDTGIWLFGKKPPLGSRSGVVMLLKSPFRMAGVGTNPTSVEPTLFSFVPCQPAKKNTLLRMIGPPAKPPYCLRFRKSFVGEKKFFALNVLSRRPTNRPPWKLLVPDRVTAFTTAPALAPWAAL